MPGTFPLVGGFGLAGVDGGERRVAQSDVTCVRARHRQFGAPLLVEARGIFSLDAVRHARRRTLRRARPALGPRSALRGPARAAAQGAASTHGREAPVHSKEQPPDRITKREPPGAQTPKIFSFALGLAESRTASAADLFVAAAGE